MFKPSWQNRFVVSSNFHLYPSVIAKRAENQCDSQRQSLNEKVAKILCFFFSDLTIRNRIGSKTFDSVSFSNGNQLLRKEIETVTFYGCRIGNRLSIFTSLLKENKLLAFGLVVKYQLLENRMQIMLH